MAVTKLKFNDKFIYVDDEVDDKKKGHAIYKEKDDLEDTMEFAPIDEKELLSDTIIDRKLFGEVNEKQ